MSGEDFAAINAYLNHAVSCGVASDERGERADFS